LTVAFQQLDHYLLSICIRSGEGTGFARLSERTSRGQVREIEAALNISISIYFRDRAQQTTGVPRVDDPTLTDGLELLRNAKVDGAITTNFDLLTDDLFPEYVCYVGQDELVLSDAQIRRRDRQEP
jgi:hypothetical protein